MKYYTEQEILKSKTPYQYIDRCLHTKIPRGRKTFLAVIWQKKTGFTVNDIMYARHRHPYWKGRKMDGWHRRNLIRWKRYDFSKGKTRRGIRDNYDYIEKFLSIDIKDTDGFYKLRDWEVAKKLNTTIPAVQALRRKRNMIYKIKKQIHHNQLEHMMSLTEQKLRKKIND